MAAAAIAARLPSPRAARAGHAGERALAFDTVGGPVVAICGLTGGAGTSTLALLLARQAASDSAAPILLAETDPMRAGLAVLTGRATPRPLLALAQDVIDDRQPTDAFVELEHGLRLIAAEPQPATATPRGALDLLLAQARDAHGLVVLDSGTHWTPDSPILAHATHIIWTLPATPTGLARGATQLKAAMTTAGRRREALAATATVTRPLASVRALRRLARQRGEQLVLIPHDEGLARGETTTSDRARHALSGIARLLRRAA
jgi:cellulose biosynthesis protein BcsQ